MTEREKGHVIIFIYLFIFLKAVPFCVCVHGYRKCFSHSQNYASSREHGLKPPPAALPQ